MKHDQEIIVIPPAPKTARGYPSSIDATQDHLLSFNGNSVIIQPHKSHHQSLTLSHASDVSAAKISHDGKFLASIDVRGTLIISEICPDRIIEVYKYQDVFPNAKDIGWSSDRKKVCIVGQGKKVFAKVLSIDTGITAGDIGSVTSTLNSCSFRPERPFKLVMAGDQYTVKCYEGPPYSFVKSDKSHANFILQVKYSPKGTYFLTGGADHKLVLYEGKNFEKLGQKTEAHSGSIFGLDWISEEYFVTISSDKLIKIWNIQFEEKFVIETTSAENMKNPKKVGLFLVAVRAINDLIYVTTLEGDILVYNNPLVSKESHLVKTYSGPRSKIAKIIEFDSNNFILLDNGGRVLNYNLLTRKTSVHAEEIEMNGIQNGFSTEKGSNKRLVILTTNGILWIYQGEETSQLKFIKKIQKIEFKNISEGSSYSHLVGLNNNKILLFNLQTEKVDKENTTNEDITSLASNQILIIAGTIKGNVHLFSFNLQKIQSITLNSFKVSNISLFPTSPSLFRCLLGDTCGNMRMVEVSSEGFKTVKETMGGHSSVITGAGVSGNFLYTFSMDGKICIWENESLQRLSEIKESASGGIVTGCVIGKRLIFSGGNLVTKVIPIKE